MGRVLHEEDLTQAMKEDLDQQADVIRISGNSWSEFPEANSGVNPPAIRRRRTASVTSGSLRNRRCA